MPLIVTHYPTFILGRVCSCCCRGNSCCSFNTKRLLQQGAKQIYANHLRPFLSRHQARVDQVLGFAYCEVIKLVSSYQAEIQFVRSMVVKITGSADQMLRGNAESDNRSPQHSSPEDPASDAETDQNHNH